MLRINILIVSLLIIPGSFSLYNEKYRPQIHFSPSKGWINDPNGLVFDVKGGNYHLFFQYNPNDIVPENIHWGHAISKDLVHWESLPIALYPTDGNAMWSGTAIFDRFNVSGLQKEKDVDTLITMFTAHDMSTNKEKQWMAFSSDGPKYKKFKLYKKNPIIPNPGGLKDFRDPAVFKYKDHYVIVLAAGDHISIYNSNDLLKWEMVSKFKADTNGRTWECPSLFSINVTKHGVEVEKWVLTISLAGNDDPVQRYFIGSFNGTTFKNECSENEMLWVDYGDSYAGIVFNDVPRRIFISWMNKWEYAPNLNLSAWSGQMGFARDLKLKYVGDEIRLSSLPVVELKILRTERLVKKRNMPITNDYVYDLAENDNETGHQLDIEMTLDLQADHSFDILFSGENNFLNISLRENEFTLDRSNAGKTDFPKFREPLKAKRLVNKSELKMRIIIDRSSIEFFADDGLTALTALFFSEEKIASKMQICALAKKSSILLKDLKAYKLKSIWK